MAQNTYKRLDSNEKIVRGFANLYVKGNRLYFRLPDRLGLGRNKYQATGLTDDKVGVSTAIGLLTVLNNDIAMGKVDLTLERYLPAIKTEAYKAEVESITGSGTNLKLLWNNYCESRKGYIKESTLHYLVRTIGDKIHALPTDNIYEAETVRDFLLKTSTPEYADRVLKKLSLLFAWCSDLGVLRGTNPYPKLLRHLPVGKSQNLGAILLSDDELATLLAKISPIYLPLTRFLFFTGCRPSEGIGLQWQDIKDDHLVLGRSITRKDGKILHSTTSKNGKTREFPINDELGEFLSTLTSNKGEESLVFPNTKGESIDYAVYSKAWARATPNKDTTPYNARDWFISTQIAKGKKPIVVAEWVDNSVRVIETTYYKNNKEDKPV